jgi:hypothetical protein
VVLRDGNLISTPEKANGFRASPDAGSRTARLRPRNGGPSVLAMTYHIDIEALLDEIRRYLAAVEAFRAAGCEPTWHPDR